MIDPESLEQIETQVSRVAGPAFAVDVHGLVVAWNQRAESLFGVTASEAIGRRCAMVVRGVGRTGRVTCQAGCPWLPIAGSAIQADIPMVIRRGPRPSTRVEVVMRHRALRDRVGRPVAVLHAATEMGRL